MAFQPQKKSSIPRATHDCDKPDPSKSKRKGLIKAPNYSSGHAVRSLPLLNDGLIPENDNAVRKSLLELEADHARMKESLEESVREAEERIQAMQNLLDERERLIAAANADRAKLEQQVEDRDNMLIENSIDPVTGEAIPLTEEQEAAVGKVKKITKAEVNKMRDTLHTMSENSDKYLIDVQKILEDIAEIEATSLRAGGLKPGETLSQEEMDEILKAMEDAQEKVDEKERKERGEDGEGERNPPTPQSSETFLTQPEENEVTKNQE